MRTLGYLIGLVVLGGVAGVALAILDYEGFPRQGAALANARWAKAPPVVTDPNVRTPRAEVPSTDFDFGTMERFSTRNHEFWVANVGQAPLKLTLGETSCACTISGLDADSVEPGGKVPVKLKWTANNSLDWFRHSAKVQTNDPEMPEIEFVVRGQVIDSVEADKALVGHISMPTDESNSTTVNVFSRIKPDLQITGYQLEDAATAAHFAVEFASVAPTEPGAQSQWSVKVTVKPGLPIGPFQQKIRLSTNVPDKPQITLTVFGSVYDIQIFGTRWDQIQGVLHLGTVDPETGGSAEVKVRVRGAQRQRVKLAVKQKNPELLQVAIEEPEPLAGGSQLQFPVRVTVPPGPPVSYLGGVNGEFGEVVLETGYPPQPELRLKVSFAVGR